MDVYVYGKCLRMCPDAPVPVMVPQETITYSGMAGNVVRNIEALGAEVDTLTNTEQIYKTRYVDSKTNHMFVRIDTGEEHIARVKDLEKINFKAYDAIVISDYCKGFLEEDDIAYIAENSNKTFLDTKKVINNIFVDKISVLPISLLNKKLSHKLNENLNLGYCGSIYPWIYPIDYIDAFAKHKDINIF